MLFPILWDFFAHMNAAFEDFSNHPLLFQEPVEGKTHIRSLAQSDESEPRRVKLHILQRSIADAVGVKSGQTVIIKRKIAVPKRNASESTAQKNGAST